MKINKYVSYLHKDCLWKRFLILLVLVGTTSLYAQVQKINITGVVNDEAGEPLIGANVVEKGTTNGTMTDMDGAFSLNVSDKGTIQIRFVGYLAQEFPVNGKTSFNIVLKEDSKILDEVVVTALGIKRSQKALSYNVQEIKSDELTTIKDANFVNSLAGKVAGVNINTSSAGVGGATRIVMRGTKSITKDNNALYVIDGVPIYNSNNGGLDQNNEYAAQPRGEGISDLNPEDIESLTVLTGPAAAALYGSSAANGAVLITTKKGASGKPKVMVSNQTTFSNPFVLPEFQNRYGNDGSYSSWGAKQNKYSYEPSDFFQTGVSIQNSVTLSVGTDKNQTYASIGSVTSDGIIENNTYDRYNVTLRNTTSMLNDKLILDFGVSYVKQKNQNMMAQGKYGNPLTGAYTFPRGEDFNALRNFETMDPAAAFPVQNWGWGDQGIDLQNPFWVINRNMDNDKKDRYMINASLKYVFNDWLDIIGRARLDNANTVFTQRRYASTLATISGPYGSYVRRNIEDKQIYADAIANINKRWGDYSLASNIGVSISDIRSNLLGYGGNLKIPNFFAIPNISKTDGSSNPEQSGQHEQIQSVFANVELGWKSMLYLTVTGRNDWASALANTNNSSFFYPSIGLSGVISEMVTLPSAISYLKVRASYSSVGSAIPLKISIPTYPYDGQSGEWKTNTYKPIGELKPERTNSWEAGLSAKFFGNRLNLEATYYKSNTKNQTFNVPISASSGWSSMYVQSGDVENQGIEISLSADNKFGNLTWIPTFTAGYNKNEIKSLVDDITDPFTGEPIVIDMLAQGGIGASEIRLMEGGTMGDLWTKTKLKMNEDGSVYVNPTTGKPQLENELTKVGTLLPKWNLGFRNDFIWKDFNLGFLITARYGGVVMSHTQAILDGFGVSEASALARDNGGVRIGNQVIDAQSYYEITGSSQGLLSDYVYKADNIRLQELSFGYNLPSNWFNNVMKVNVSFIGRNLWMIKNDAPFDPESSASTGTYFQGMDYFMQPSLRNLGFSIKAQF